ncbi:MAG: 6-phosphogluconolactonase [uncultured Phycisphaerae bacterium]|uniref:6-phosphogluconolactonase n=1 Tax=uncultured Phycisphaerae bacterium TaxID=904963 RepID=A0A6J4P2F1_9BACT|nr:MAG: 6-phosphogluconolactonase [uncultured Phycisphaerae bacterium]
MTRPARWIAACLAAAATFVTSHARAEKLLLPDDAPAGEVRVYFGTYTGKSGSKGIYVSTLDLATGKLSPPELAGETTNPSFLAIHPSKRFLYAVGEVNEINGKKAGAVSAFAIQPDGKLSPLNQQPSGGQGPCHVSVDKEGRNVLVANYGSGAVACLPIGADGKLAEPSATVQHEGKSVDPRRQAGPHAHSINLDPANRFAFAADLGLDKVLVYRFDAAAGKLTPNDPSAAAVAPGAGPRHFAFHPTGRFAYVINEMASTVTAFAYDAAKGTLTEVHTVPTLPGEVKGNSTAEVVVHPSGKFVYGSNRGHDSIAGFAVDEATGKLTPIGHTPTRGKTPRNFNIDPTGTYLLAANQGTSTVAVYRIDPASGALAPVGEPTAVPAPVCVKYLQP